MYGDGLSMQDILVNLQQLDANIFIPVSPNINWNNQSIGKDPIYFQKNQVGGSATITSDIWTSKISHSS
jgi:hypothetical protein